MPELSALLNFLFLASREDTVAAFCKVKAIGLDPSAQSRNTVKCFVLFFFLSTFL